MISITRTRCIEGKTNDDTLQQKNALIDELRLEVMKVFEDIKARYDKNVKKWIFKIGDWVLRRAA